MPAESFLLTNLPCGIPGLTFALLHEHRPIKCHDLGVLRTHHGPYCEKSSMTTFLPPISDQHPSKSPLRASGRCLLTLRGFQVALQSFKKLHLVLSQKFAAFTKAGA